MTWKRVVNRNGLADGDYYKSPSRHLQRLVLKQESDEAKLALYDLMVRQIESYDHSLRMLAGDLRRLETDAVDEREVCRIVSQRSGIDDMNIVAAVIKEFLNV